MDGQDKPFRTKSGRILSDEEIEALADEAERGYEVSEIVAVTDERRAELRRLAEQ